MSAINNTPSSLHWLLLIDETTQGVRELSGHLFIDTTHRLWGHCDFPLALTNCICQRLGHSNICCFWQSTTRSGGCACQRRRAARMDRSKQKRWQQTRRPPRLHSRWDTTVQTHTRVCDLSSESVTQALLNCLETLPTPTPKIVTIYRPNTKLAQ